MLRPLCVSCVVCGSGLLTHGHAMRAAQVMAEAQVRTHGGGGHLLLAGKEAGACVVADSRQNREHGAIYGAAIPRVISMITHKMASFDATTAVFLFPAWPCRWAGQACWQLPSADLCRAAHARQRARR